MKNTVNAQGNQVHKQSGLKMKVSRGIYVLTSMGCIQGNTPRANRNSPWKRVEQPGGCLHEVSTGRQGWDIAIARGTAAPSVSFFWFQRVKTAFLMLSSVHGVSLWEPIRAPLSTIRKRQDVSPNEDAKGDFEYANGWRPTCCAIIRATGLQNRRDWWCTHPTAVTTFTICGPGHFGLPRAFERLPRWRTVFFPIYVPGGPHVLTTRNWPSPPPPLTASESPETSRQASSD